MGKLFKQLKNVQGDIDKKDPLDEHEENKGKKRRKEEINDMMK